MNVFKLRNGCVIFMPTQRELQGPFQIFGIFIIAINFFTIVKWTVSIILIAN